MKTYHVEVIQKDGKTNISRRSYGFNALELIGILEQSKQDILNKIAGLVKPNVVERTVVVDKVETTPAPSQKKPKKRKG